eukprot:6500089-Pyramimonas_sp.AAC.1
MGIAVQSDYVERAKFGGMVDPLLKPPRFKKGKKEGWAVGVPADSAASYFSKNVETAGLALGGLVFPWLALLK